MSYLNYAKLKLAVTKFKLIRDIDDVIDLRQIEIRSSVEQVNREIDKLDAVARGDNEIHNL